MIIDSHAHMYYDNIIDDIEKIIDNCLEAGVEKIIVPSVDIPTAEKTLSLAEKYDMIYTAFGFHPCDINNIEEKDLTSLKTLLKYDKVKAIGEIGLDYFWHTENKSFQKEIFKEQLNIAIETKFPVIIHTRDSIDDVIEIISDNKYKDIKMQMHCFAGNITQLNELMLNKNIYYSFCGNITFKNFDKKDVVKKVPIDKLLFETDSPFLTPVPFRGNRNDPSKIVFTIKKISEFLNIDVEKLKKIVQQNTLSFFNF